MSLTDSDIHVIDNPGLSSDARRLAEARSVRVLRVKAGGVTKKLTLMERLADGLSFPSHFGKNWDALYGGATATELRPLRLDATDLVRYF